jgi:drug/metabolite transporter (DMT)-like permease
LGELFALLTGASWALASTAFAGSALRIGAVAVNVLRLWLALAVLVLVTSVARRAPLPLDADGHAWLWLSASGVVGLTVGDLCLFRAYALIGNRPAMLVMTTAPFVAVALGLAFLGEVPTVTQLLGVILTLAGIALAIADRPGPGHARPSLAGLLLALGGAVCQGVGLVLSKPGLSEVDPIAGNQIRLLAGALGMTAWVLVSGRAGRLAGALRDRRGTTLIVIGSIFGPLLGITFSLQAIRHAEVGVAASLMATTPIWLLPIARLRGEPLGTRSVVGAVIAVAGVAVLFA